MLMIAFLVFCCLMSWQIVLTVYTNHIRWINMLIYDELRTAVVTLWAAWVAHDQAAAEEIIAAHMAAVGPIPPIVCASTCEGLDGARPWATFRSVALVAGRCCTRDSAR